MTGSRDDTVRSYLDDDCSVSTAVVRAVAAALDRAPSQVEPLDSVVNPGELEALFAPRSNGSSRDGGSVTFTFEGCEVTVHADDEITVRPPERQ